MRFTPADAAFIEHIAQEQLRYETIFSNQAEVLRADIPNYERAMTQFKQSPLAAKPGQCWQPAEDNVDEYLAQCNAMCHSVPQDFDELSHL